MKKFKKLLIVVLLLTIVGIIIWQIPTIADWGDYESYDSSSSYDDWGSSSSDWGSSSSDWDSDDYGWSSSSSSSGDGFWIGYLLGRLFESSPIGGFIFIIIIIAIVVYAYKNRHNSSGFTQKYQSTMMNRPSFDVEAQRRKNRDELFGVSDASIETTIQAEDPLFNKAEFLAWAGDRSG